MHSLIIISESNGRDLEEIMEQFDESREVEEYCTGDVSEMDKQRFIDFYNEKIKGYHLSMEQFDELYKEHGESWNFNRWRKDDDGIWREYSTYNPESLWDWYEVGGRWAGTLELKEGIEPMYPVHFSWGWEEEDRKKVREMSPKRADVAYLKDIANLSSLKAGNVIINGENIDLSNGLYFGEVAPHLNGLPEDTLITCVDCHI